MTPEETRERVYAMRAEILAIISRNKDVECSFTGFFCINIEKGIDITTMSTLDPDLTKRLLLQMAESLPDTPTRSIKL